MFNVAIIGASGLIGRSVLEILHERNFPIKNLYLLGRVEQELSLQDKVLQCTKIDEFDFESADIVFNAASSDVIRNYLGKIFASNAILIDKSDAMRMDKDISLCIPEVNSSLLNENKIICSPNCVAIPIAIILNILSYKTKIEQIFASAFQSVSGAGSNGTKALLEETKKTFMAAKVSATFFQKSIAFDVLPQIGDLDSQAVSSEESKVQQEVQKILDKKIQISITCSRVPVLVGHAIDLHIPCDISRKDAIAALSSSDSIHVCDRDDAYMTQRESANEDVIFISRVRSVNGVLSMWVSYDNIRVGGALNGVKIAEVIAEKLNNKNN